MRRKKDDIAYLWDMLEAAEAVEEFMLGQTFDDYMRSRMLRSAVERNIYIIGEAANHVTGAFREQHRDIPWIPIIGQRHILAHEYGELEDELLYETASKDIPKLILQLQTLLAKDSQ